MLGLLGLGMLATQLVASGRQRWVAAGVGQDNLLQFHRRTGLVAWILVLSHPLLLMVGDPGFVAWIGSPRGSVARRHAGRIGGGAIDADHQLAVARAAGPPVRNLAPAP